MTVLIADVQQVLGGLGLANDEKVKAKNTNAWALLEKWWVDRYPKYDGAHRS